MLPAAHRMRHSREFTHALRRGRRASQPSVVIHAAPGPHDQATRVGLIVSKGVGNAVVRHRVSRRLRAVLAQQLTHSAARWDTGHLMVVRALPSSATRTSAELAADLDRAWRALADRSTARTSRLPRELVDQA